VDVWDILSAGVIWYGMVWYGMVWYGYAGMVIAKIDIKHPFHIISKIRR
jgi:hypothetical protein